MSGWVAREPEHVALHCTCGLSFEAEVLSGAQALTRAWWQVHCGEGHGYSPVHVDTPTEVETLQAYAADIQKGGEA